MVVLAPQLTHGFVGAQPGQPFTESQLDAITSVEEVDEFAGYPDKWLSRSADLFDHEDMPLFRVMAANRRGGPDAEGRSSIIQVRSAHALLEGSDSALLTRSQSAGHGIMSNQGNKVAFGSRLRGALRAFLMTTIHLFFAYALSPPDRPTHFRTLALPRDRMRRLATALGVRQRSLYFALVTYALHSGGDRHHKVIAANYTMLDTERNAADDDFFRVRTLEAKFRYDSDFNTYVRGVDEVMERIEQQDVTRFQMAINALFTMHRKLHSLAPWLYGPRFWRFGGGGNIVLTLVPPHRAVGPLTEWMVEPIYCGAYHPAANICTFCPGREFMTVNFAMEQRHVERVDEVMGLLERVEATAIAPAAAEATPRP
jgi:hypothetical protein